MADAFKRCPNGTWFCDDHEWHKGGCLYCGVRHPNCRCESHPFTPFIDGNCPDCDDEPLDEPIKPPPGQ
jgi:hypothetical protein